MAGCCGGGSASRNKSKKKQSQAVVVPLPLPNSQKGMALKISNAVTEQIAYQMRQKNPMMIQNRAM